jgi:hypothetical protein
MILDIVKIASQVNPVRCTFTNSHQQYTVFPFKSCDKIEDCTVSQVHTMTVLVQICMRDNVTLYFRYNGTAEMSIV